MVIKGRAGSERSTFLTYCWQIMPAAPESVGEAQLFLEQPHTQLEASAQIGCALRQSGAAIKAE